MHKLHGRYCCVRYAAPLLNAVLTTKFSGSEFTWVGSAYALASTAFLPMSGGVAQIFGRKPVLLGFLTFFIVGSAICGASTSLNMLIAGRSKSTVVF